MKITDHAVDRYIERVLNIEKSMAGDDIREMGKKKIKEAAESPDEVINPEKDKAPIHVKGLLAIPVDEEGDGTGNTTVPTVYHKGAFINE